MLERLQTLIPNPLPRPGRRTVIAAAVLAATGTALWLLATHPPVQTVAPGEVVLRTNRYTGEVSRHREGTLAVLAGLRRRSLSLPRGSERRRRWSAGVAWLVLASALVATVALGAGAVLAWGASAEAAQRWVPAFAGKTSG